MIRGTGNVSLTFIRGETYDNDIAFTSGGSPLDLSSWVGGSKGVRCKLLAPNRTGSVVATPTVSIRAPATDGLVRFQLTSTQTIALNSGNADSTSGVWDLEAYDASVSPEVVTKLVLESAWSCAGEVTQ